jgi:hypothetical protein
VTLLPGVITSLKEAGKLGEFLTFNRLLNEKRFPLTNVAFLLFLDVVRWLDFDTLTTFWLDFDTLTTFMRYSNEVKLFWSTGLQLFHGRFLKLYFPLLAPNNQTIAIYVYFLSFDTSTHVSCILYYSFPNSGVVSRNLILYIPKRIFINILDTYNIQFLKTTQELGHMQHSMLYICVDVSNDERYFINLSTLNIMCQKGKVQL